MTNPWNITLAQGEALEALAQFGSAKEAARELGISHKTIEVHMHEAKKRMGIAHRVVAIVAYDRFIRGAR